MVSWIPRTLVMLMKKVALILFVLIQATGCSKKIISYDLLKYDKGKDLLYLDEIEFTGTALANNNSCRTEYKRGVRNGKEQIFSSDNRLLQETIFKNGARVSYTSYHYANGKKESFWRFKNEKQDGPEIKWDIHGKKTVDRIFNEGVIEVSFSRYNNGNVRFDQYQKDGNLKVIEYREDGTKCNEMTYAFNNGMKKQGEHKFYNKAGQLMRTEFYKDDVLVDKKVIRD